MNKPRLCRVLQFEIDTAPLIIQAVALRALASVPAATSLCQQLARRLLQQADVTLQDGKLFDAFVLLDAIAAYDTSLLSGKLWAKAIKRLIAAERAVGGPYAEASARPRLSTNAAINSLLKNAGRPLPQVEQFLKNQMQQAIYVESVAITGLRYYHHAEDIFQFPIIAAVFRLVAKHTNVVSVSAPVRREAIVVLRGARRALQNLHEPLRVQGITMIDELAHNDTHNEVTLLSFLFQQSLVTHTTLSPQLWRQLGTANVLYWIAYTAYDNFLDDEGQPERLSIANVCMRRSVSCFQQAAPSVSARKWVASVFDTIDASNAWELENCRGVIRDSHLVFSRLPLFKGRQLLARRAYAHVLGPLIIARYSGVFSHLEQRTLERAWQHFLVARQLSDDMYDWVDDLCAGHLSFVVSDMLHVLQVSPGRHDLITLKRRMQTFFWQHGIERYAQLVAKHSKEAKRLFRQVPTLLLHPELSAIIARLESVTEAAVRRLQNEKQFLESYR